MNFAFTTILIFILLSPGFIARSVYHSSKLSVRDKNLVNELTWSILPAIALHLLFIFIIEKFTIYFVDFKQLGLLLFPTSNKEVTEQVFAQLDLYKYKILTYNLIIFILAFFSGLIIRKLVRHFKLDRKVRYFRFTNKWHYIFTGECLDFNDVPDKYIQITDKIINILCKVNGESILYTGEYFNYYLDQYGELEAVHLRNPIRRYLKDDQEDNQKYYVIPSRYLVIPSKDIVNINFRYLSLTEIKPDELTEEDIQNVIELDSKEESQNE